MRSEPNVRLTWIGGLAVTGKSSRIPARPGVYAYGVIRHSAGLVSTIDWVYIGKASISLRQRISSHDSRYESNPGLQQWLRNPPANAELWFAEVPVANIDATEQQLIRDINPRFNKNHRTNKS